MNTPDLQPGPLTAYGPFIRNIQAVPDRNDMWIVEVQQGTKGSGKKWRPAIIVRNPNFSDTPQHYTERDRFAVVGEVKPSQRSGYGGFHQAQLWFSYQNHPRPYVEAFFPTQGEAIQFLLNTSKNHVPDAPRHP